jgi:hypothetical protein
MSSFPKNTPFISRGKQSIETTIVASTEYDGALILPYQTNQANSTNLIIPEGVPVHLAADGEVEIHDGSLPLLGVTVLGNNTTEVAGFVGSNSVYAGKESEVMVMLNGSFVILMVSTGAIAVGAKVMGGGSIEADTVLCKVSPLTAAEPIIGTAMQAAAGADEIIRVLVKV